MHLLDPLAISRHRFPEKVALRFVREDGGVGELRYAELWEEVNRLAAAFADRGLHRGERVALLLGNRPEYVLAHLAVLSLGAVVLPINLAYRRREIAHIFEDAEPRFVIAENGMRPILDELAPDERASVEAVIPAEGLADLAAKGSTGSAVVRADGSDLAMLLYTSGTTGRSKGAMLTHDNLLATVAGLLTAWAWEPTDVLHLALPLFHVHGLVVGLHCALAAGATVRLYRRFDAAVALDDLAAGRANLFFGVPTMYVRLLDELRRRDPRPDLSQVRLFCSGSAPLAPETFAGFRDATGHEVLERYGMTEAGMILSNRYVGPRLPGSVGVPLPGVSARIVDAAGEDLPAGAEGELLVRGANVFAGYWRDPEKTAASFSTDASGRRWLRTGDLARRDSATGGITLLGRRHELILCGGFNVYPREIEEVLESYPGIREAAVAGRKDPEWGEVPVAYLVADGADTELDADALTAFCRERMAGFKVPRAFQRQESLPRNALGKLQKHLLP